MSATVFSGEHQWLPNILRGGDWFHELGQADTVFSVDGSSVMALDRRVWGLSPEQELKRLRKKQIPCGVAGPYERLESLFAYKYVEG